MTDRETWELLQRLLGSHVLDAGVMFAARHARPQQAAQPFDRAANAREIRPIDVTFAPTRGDQ